MSQQSLRQGLHGSPNGRWEARFWAPAAARVALRLPLASRLVSLQPDPLNSGYWTAQFQHSAPRFAYVLEVDEHRQCVDPFAAAFERGEDGKLVSVAVAHSVIDATVKWQRPTHRNLVVYECHLRGYTALRDDVPAQDRGTARAWHDGTLARELVQMGFTAVEFLPVHAFEDEPHLGPLGLSNYWGYNTLGFFALDPRYGSKQDFQKLVQACHGEGLKVIIDVVYNHTAESDHNGPVRAYKALANDQYYRLDAQDPNRYQNPTGTGNSLDSSREQVKALVLSSLTFWHQEMGVDGFRFDLAPTLARGQDGQMGGSDLLDQIASEPQLADALLIAEPWDIGPDGYQLGGQIFGQRWLQWDDRFRDSARRLMAEPSGALRSFAEHLVGQSSRVGFVTAHDGFSLMDLVSYVGKHNWANGEENRDGHNHNLSVNFGTEGPSDDPQVLARRQNARQFFLALMAMSRPVPMFSMGDELGRTQGGNNNAYCQDNQISWLDWHPDQPGQDLRKFVREWLGLRHRHLQGFLASIITPQNCHWLDASGQAMTSASWEAPGLMALSMLFDQKLAVSLVLTEGSIDLPEGFRVVANSSHQGLAPYVQLAINDR